MDVAGSSQARDTLWILGGGTLADLPVGELAAMFRQVVIFDIALLRSARRIAKRWPNVELRSADVTGLVQPLAGWKTGMPLPVPGDGLKDLGAAPDCVLSLNLMSQLPLLPMQYLQRAGISRLAAEGFGRRILQAHLDGLGPLGCPVGVTADLRRIWRSRAGEPVMSENALLDIELPAVEQEWTWPLAPLGEIDPETGLDVRVGALRLNC